MQLYFPPPKDFETLVGSQLNRLRQKVCKQEALRRWEEATSAHTAHFSSLGHKITSPQGTALRWVVSHFLPSNSVPQIYNCRHHCLLVHS